MQIKRTIFITGTDTGVGKTVLTALLARFLRERGVSVAALKPVCSGSRDNAHVLSAALGGALALDEINPWHFRAPVAPMLAARREKKSLKLAPVLEHIRAVRRNYDVVLIEGAGGLLSPLGDDFNSRDLISVLRATPVIVAPNRLGVINHIRLTLEALPKNLRALALVVLMTSPETDPAAASNVALLRQLSVQNVCRLPWFGANFSAAIGLEKPQARQVMAELGNFVLQMPVVSRSKRQS